MNKLYTMVIATSAVVASCATPPTSSAFQPLAADTTLTAAEKEARIFTPEIMLKMGRLSSSTLSPDGKSVAYILTYHSVTENRSYSSLWVAPADGGQAKQLTDYSGKENSPQWSADGNQIYFLSNRGGGSYQIWSINPDGSALTQLSSLERPVNGFGVSPKGDNVWLVMDVQVEKVASSKIYENLDKSNALIYDDLMTRHWDAWEDGSYSHLFIAPFANGQVGVPQDITEGEPWDVPTAPYYDNSEIAWNNGGTALAYTAKKLRGKEYAVSTDTDIYLYTIAGGQTRNLTQGMVGYDKYPRFSPNDEMVAWQSMERPSNESDKDRLMVLNIATGEKNYVTYDFDYNAANLVWSADNKDIYFIAPIEATHQICRAEVGSRKITVLTQGLHDYTAFSMAGDMVVAEKTTISMATELFNVDLAKGDDKQMSFINANIYANVDMGQVEKRWVKTTDNKQMLTWVIKPSKFDSSKKYPTLLFCQGGPQSVVSQAWSYRWNFQLMASQGYVVVAPNRRGLPSFGQEWLDQISGDYSGQNQADYMSAIDDVSNEPYVDKDRRGCVGASYGGYSVYYIAGHHDKRFKAFIAHCGMYDLTSFYGSTEELWFPNNDLGGAYWDKNNKTAQRSFDSSPHLAAQNWDTPMLILVGLKDYRIPYTQSLEAFTAARMQGIPARLVAFEDEAHQVFGAQNAMVWNNEFFGWLDKYLKTEK